jgi:hypothetical protein
LLSSHDSGIHLHLWVHSITASTQVHLQKCSIIDCKYNMKPTQFTSTGVSLIPLEYYLQLDWHHVSIQFMFIT